jgi:hypothetical protein
VTTALAPSLVLADTNAAAAAAEVKPAMVRSWAHRGYIKRHGYDRTGRTLVDVAEVQAYADTRRAEERRLDESPDLL